MKTIETRALQPSLPGTRRHVTILRYGRPGAGPKAYIQAALHADELPAILAATHLAALLDQADILGEIVLVPAANPVGFDQTVNGMHLGRYELHSGENFNRSFPDLADVAAERLRGKLGRDPAANIRLIRATLAAILDEGRPLSELASLRCLLMRAAIDADYVLDLHCDDDALLHLYLGAARWPDGEDLSAEIGSVATLYAAESGGMPFDELFSNIWALLRAKLDGPEPIPDACLAATVELRGRGDVSDELGRQDAEALFRFLQRRGVVAGDPGPLPAPLCAGTPLAAVDVLRAPVGGIVLYRAALGQTIKAGEIVAEILDPMATEGRGRVAVTAATDGVLFARRHRRLVRPGQDIGKIAGQAPLPSRVGKLLDP